MILGERRWSCEALFVFCIFWGDLKATLRQAQGERIFLDR